MTRIIAPAGEKNAQARGESVTTYYISPTGSGRADGSSWQNAARINQLNSLVDRAGPGDTILLRADQGAYNVTTPIILRAGGDTGAPITIRGVDGAGVPMAAEFVSNRNLATGAPGGEIFRLMNGADHLVFENMAFRNVGNGAFRFGADVTDITIQHVDAYNVQRLIENSASGTNTSASVTGLVVRDVEVHGFSKGVVHLQYNSSNILIEDVYGDSERQSHDNFAMGVHLDGTVHDVVIRRATMGNAYNSMSDYWNGDGFATERGVYNVRFEGTRSFGNTDAGYDLKSSNTVLVDAYAANNKRNYRFWSDSITLQNSVGDDPDKVGGSGSEAQVWLADGAKATIIDSRFTNTDNGATVFSLSMGALLTLMGTVTYSGAGAVYSSVQSGASITTAPSPAPSSGAGALTQPTEPAPTPSSGAGALTQPTQPAPTPTPTGTIGDGADTLTGTSGADQLTGGKGADVIHGAGGADTIIGDGESLSTGVAPGDMVNGGDGNDTIYGDAVTLSGDAVGGNDVLNGDAGADVIYGDAMNMSGSARGGSDTIHGGAGDDRIYGDAANKHPYGGADLLFGDDGDDLLSGGAGDDYLDGGRGADTLVGGAGADVFHFADLGHGVDHVTDFAAGDRIALAPQLAGVSSAADVHLLFDTNAAAAAGPTIRYDQTSGRVYFDANGGSSSDQVLMAILDNHPALTHDNFIVM